VFSPHVQEATRKDTSGHEDAIERGSVEKKAKVENKLGMLIRVTDETNYTCPKRQSWNHGTAKGKRPDLRDGVLGEFDEISTRIALVQIVWPSSELSGYYLNRSNLPAAVDNLTLLSMDIRKLIPKIVETLRYPPAFAASLLATVTDPEQQAVNIGSEVFRDIVPETQRPKPDRFTHQRVAGIPPTWWFKGDNTCTERIKALTMLKALLSTKHP